MTGRRDILDWLAAESAAFARMADEIWSHPEIAFHERLASELQAAYLRVARLPRAPGPRGHRRPRSSPNGAPGRPVIGLLGEYDALAGLSQKRQPTPMPEVEGGPGHGCGHNLLGTACVASAAALRRWLEATGRAGNGPLLRLPGGRAGDRQGLHGPRRRLLRPGRRAQLAPRGRITMPGKGPGGGGPRPDVPVPGPHGARRRFAPPGAFRARCRRADERRGELPARARHREGPHPLRRHPRRRAAQRGPRAGGVVVLRAGPGARRSWNR